MPDDGKLFGAGNRHDDWTELVPPALMVLGAVSLLRSSRLLSLGLVGAYFYKIARKHDTAWRVADRRVQIADEDSFPASDPPAYTGSIV